MRRIGQTDLRIACGLVGDARLVRPFCCARNRSSASPEYPTVCNATRSGSIRSNLSPRPRAARPDWQGQTGNGRDRPARIRDRP